MSRKGDPAHLGDREYISFRTVGAALTFVTHSEHGRGE